MTEEHDLGAGLIARTAHTTATSPHRLDIVFPGGGSGLRFERCPERTRARLAFAGWRATPDVSAQPGAIVRQLDLTAREHAIDPHRWQHLVLGALRAWHGSLDWCQQLLAAVGAITHPLLASVYERGHAPSAELPRWGAAVLRQPTAADASRALCTAPTRRVTRSLAASLVCRPLEEHIDFTPLGWAVAAADLVDADVLATLLDTRRAPTQSEAPSESPATASVDDIAAVRDGIRHWPRDRRGALLLDAARSHEMSELVTALTHLRWVRDRIDQALPVRVDDLRALCRRHVPVLAPSSSSSPAAAASHTADPTPTAAPDPGHRTNDPGAARPARRRAATAPAAASAAAGVAHPALGDPLTGASDPAAAEPQGGGTPAPQRARRRTLLPAQPLGAPRARGVALAPGVAAELRWPVPAALLEVHGHCRNGITFDVATNALELRRWGQQLRNCIGSFAEAMLAGQSWLIGLLRDDVLIGCVEVNPLERRVVQATGVANRALPLWVQRTVADTLADLRVTRTT